MSKRVRRKRLIRDVVTDRWFLIGFLLLLLLFVVMLVVLPGSVGRGGR